MKCVGVIPARMASSRLPEKVLRPIAGKPMIFHVWQRAREASRLDDVIVACDDPRIESCVKEFGGRAVLTRRDHPNGSSRAAEVAAGLDADVIVNIQGDEPLIHPANIDRVAEVFSAPDAEDVVTLAVRKTGKQDFENPNAVKVVCDRKGRALYFSRAPIPYDRDKREDFSFLKHLGIYGYRRKFLLDFVTWETGRLEDMEKLEQLRILERGFTIRVVETPYDSPGVDTQEDLARAEAELEKLRNQKIQ